MGPANTVPSTLRFPPPTHSAVGGHSLWGGLERSDMLLAVAGGTLCRVFVGRPLSNTAFISGRPKPGCGTYVLNWNRVADGLRPVDGREDKGDEGRRTGFACVGNRHSISESNLRYQRAHHDQRPRTILRGWTHLAPICSYILVRPIPVCDRAALAFPERNIAAQRAKLTDQPHTGGLDRTVAIETRIVLGTHPFVRRRDPLPLGELASKRKTRPADCRAASHVFFIWVSPHACHQPNQPPLGSCIEVSEGT